MSQQKQSDQSPNPPPLPTASERRILEALWSRPGSAATAPEIRDVLNSGVAERDDGAMSIQTLHKFLSLMDSKGFIARSAPANSKHIVFRPVVSREEIGERTVQDLRETIFHGDFASMAMPFLRTASDDEMQLLKDWLDEWQAAKKRRSDEGEESSV